MIKLGVIADDFTGATDIASFLVNNNMSTIQFNGVPANNEPIIADAVVISLKSRSNDPKEAISDSLAALNWLQQNECQQFYFKYCSTFDSTSEGNIGPVTDALLDALGEQQTIISPALPVNGRTVYQGYLFVMDQLLSESGMRNHPVTPMKDSHLKRLMEAQASGRCGVIPATIMDQGANAVKRQLEQLKSDGFRYVVMDTLNEQHLLTQAEAVQDMKLVTGGSGLAIGLARLFSHSNQGEKKAQAAGYPQGKHCVVFSGSCSTMTNKQVAAYQSKAPCKAIDVARYLLGSIEERETYIQSLCQWANTNKDNPLAPMIYATTSAEELHKIQQEWGANTASKAIEQLFSLLCKQLHKMGFTRFIVAGGETAGVVVQSLNINAFHIGPTISPGVPWVRAVNTPISLALKSGNFGDEDFFARAQKEFAV